MVEAAKVRGSVRDLGSARGTRLRLGAPVPGRGSRSQPGRCPLESVHLSGVLRFGFVAGRKERGVAGR